MLSITSDDVIKLMQARGFKLIGKGFFSIVFQSPRTKEILKIFRRDAGYDFFIKIVADNPQCMYFPKFRAYHKFPNWENWHAIKLEPLEKISDREWENYDWIGLAVLYYTTNSTKLLSNQMKQKAVSGINNFSELGQACKILAEARNLSSKPWFSIDIGRENIMKRPDGAIVIIDPFS